MKKVNFTVVFTVNVPDDTDLSTANFGEFVDSIILKNDAIIWGFETIDVEMVNSYHQNYNSDQRKY